MPNMKTKDRNAAPAARFPRGEDFHGYPAELRPASFGPTKNA
jgi:hypothetical protein